jgi:hypothetical protein
MDFDPLILGAIKARFGSNKTIDDLKQEGITYESLIPVMQSVLNGKKGVLGSLLAKQLQKLFGEITNTSVIKIKTPKVRVTTENKDQLKKLYEIEKVFWSDLFSKNICSQITIGHIIFSAVRYGALLYKPRIEKLINAINNEIYYCNNYYWLNLENNKECYDVRWQPDSLTLALILCWKNKVRGNFNKSSYSQSWFTSLKKIGLQDITQTQFIEACASVQSLKIPASLVDTQTLKTHSRCLSDNSFFRLLSLKRPKLEISTDSSLIAQKVPSQSNFFQLKVNDERKDAELLRRTGSFLRSNMLSPLEIKQEIVKLLDEYTGSCSPVNFLLCEWSAYRLTEKNYWGNKFSPSSAYTRRCNLRSPLNQFFGEEDIASLSLEQLNDGYREIIDSVNTVDQRIKLTKNLRDFHHFLDDKYNMGDFEEAPWDWLSADSKNVDARVVWPWEYRQARDFLIGQIVAETNPRKIWQWRCCSIALILGYRCGMRRSEIRLLLRSSVVGNKNTEVLVRPRKDYKLKSLSSNRRIPIHVLLTNDEYLFFKEFLQLTVDATYLLADFSDRESPVTADYLFQPIQSLLKQVTGDSSARFHHLRHSVATINYCRWMLYGRGANLYGPIFEADIDLNKQCICILGEGSKTQNKILHALSNLLGHSGPQMTLMHYLHSIDLVLPYFCNRALRSFTQEQVASLLGLSSRQIRHYSSKYQLENNNLLDVLVKDKLKKYAYEVKLSRWSNFPPQLFIDNTDALIFDNTYLRLWQAVVMCTYSNQPIDVIAEKYSVSITRLENSLKRAANIMNLKYEIGGYRTNRHSLYFWRKNKDSHTFFNQPVKKKDFLWVCNILNTYKQLNKENKNIVNKAIRYFVANCSANKADIPFTTKQDLQDFLRIFDCLQLNHKDNPQEKLYPAYAVVLKHKAGMRSLARQKAWDYWRDTPNLMTNFRKDRIKEAHKYKHGILCIRTLAKAPKIKKERAVRQAAWGFRLGLYVLAITIEDIDLT